MKKSVQETKPKQQETNDDEIDLNQLLIIIGNGFTKVLNFFKSILIGLFTFLMKTLLFFRYNFKKLAFTAILGAVVGGVYQYAIRAPQYESSMTIEPNFGSAVQLYKNIEHYLSLIEQDDHDRLASSLKISPEEAENISWIGVKPYSNENQIMLSYKGFIERLDTNTVKLIDYETWAKKQPVESFKYHVVKIVAKDKFIFTKLEKPIIASIVDNTYYDKVKKTAYLNLISKKATLENSMIELDSLRILYKKLLLAESMKEASGTNIFMSDIGKNNKEVALFDKYMTMNEQLIDVNKKLTEENEVVNVVSSFNAVGMRVNDWYKNYAVLGFIGGFSIMFLYIGLKGLGKFLDGYERSPVAV